MDNANPDAPVLRMAGLGGEQGLNVVTSMLRLAGECGKFKVVDDQIRPPTWTSALINHQTIDDTTATTIRMPTTSPKSPSSIHPTIEWLLSGRLLAGKLRADIP